MADRKPSPVPKEALAYFRAKDLRVGFSYQDVWLQENAHAFTVAKAMRLDILDDIRAAGDDALANGTTFREFAKQLRPTLEKKGWWGKKEVTDPATGETVIAQLGSPSRLRTIYDANLRSARAAGQWERIDRTKKALPYLVYEIGPSRVHRQEHLSWRGIILPVDHPWWRDHYPPNDYGCKCWARQISAAEAERLIGTGQYRTEAPRAKPRTFVNKRTGERTRVDRGLHPAWASNPGQDRVRVIREHLVDKIESQDQRYARIAAKTVIDSPILDSWVQDRQGEIAAGVLDRNLQRALDAQSQVVRLSAQTLEKQDRAHGDLSLADYRALPDFIAGAIAIKQDGDRVALFKQIGGRWWKAAIKTTKKKDKIYLVSYHKTDAGEVRRETARGNVLRSTERS